MSRADPIVAVRTKIVRLKAERRSIATAPIPLDAALTRVRSAIDRAAGNRRPVSLRPFMAAGETPGLDLAAELQRDATAALCWLLGDRLAALLEHDLRAAYAGPDAAPMPEGGRVQALARLDRDIAAAELEEERLIRLAEDAGVSIERRDDADPAAVLAEMED
jgi:hypothetical protein